MGSYPTFDPNLLTKPITQARYEQLFGEETGAPLFNRAIDGLYSTGSTFKVTTALAALAEPDDHAGDADRRRGLHRDRQPRVLQREERPNGAVDLRRRSRSPPTSTTTSSARAWTATRARSLQAWARKLGFGRETGIDLPDEAEGLVPDREWREKVNEEEASAASGARSRRAASPTCATATRATTSTSRSARATCSRRRCRWRSPTRRSPTAGACRAAPRPRGPGRHRRAHPAHRARAPRAGSRSTRRPRRHHGRPARGGAGAGRHVDDVFTDWPRDLPVFGKTGTAERTGSPTRRGTSPTSRPHAGAARSSSPRRRGARRLRRRGRRADRAPHPLPALRGREEVRPRGVQHAMTGVQAPVPSPLRSALRLPVDPLLVLATVGLAALSLAAIGASTQDDIPGSPSYYLQRQGIFFAVGAVHRRRAEPARLLAAARAEVRPLRRSCSS